MLWIFLLLGACGEADSPKPPKKTEPIELPLEVVQVIVMPYAGVTSDSYLQCVPEITGQDAATLETTYSWINLRTEEELSTSYDLQLSTANVLPLDEISCTVSANDSRGVESQASAAVVVEKWIVHTDDITHSFIGERASDQLGTGITNLGDIDGDGNGEFIVAAPNSSAADPKSGTVYLLSSLEDTLIEPKQVFYGEGIKQFAGTTVAAAGDTDRDGYTDLFVSALGNDDGGLDAGKVYLMYAESFLFEDPGVSLVDADVVFVGEAPGDAFGSSVLSMEDLDGDNIDDFLISAPNHKANGHMSGKVYLYSGAEADQGTLITTFSGNQSYDRLGQLLKSAGDVDGDGLLDFWMSAPSNLSNYGQVYLMLGATVVQPDVDLTAAHAVVTSENNGDMFGEALATGDVDGDGIWDLLVGAPGNDDMGYLAGKAYVVYSSQIAAGGELSIADADLQFTAEDADNRVGTAVEIIDDIDGDALSEILIGAPGNSTGNSYAGKVYYIPSTRLEDLGSEIELSSISQVIIGNNAYDAVGATLQKLQDMDNDGLGDFLIGAPQANHGGSDSGVVYLVLGQDL